MATMRRMNTCLFILPCFVLSWFCCSGISNAGDTLRAGEVMEDWKSLESSKQLFRLRFLSVNSNRYLVIQYLPSIGTKVVWVANPQNPLNDSSGILIMAQDGNLVITDNRGISIPINSEQPAMSGNTSATLLDSGNLVLRAGEQIVWQSFDYPLDTFIPGMKLGFFDLKTGRPRNRFLTSCVSAQVAAPGAFTLGVDPFITNQLVIWQRGVPYWRSGIWNGYNFSYLPDLRLYDAFNKFNFSYFSNENESYFTFTVNDDSVFGWIEMDSFGRLTQFVSTGGGSLLPLLACDDDKVERSKGCVTPEPSRCSSGDVFPQISGVMSEWKYLHNSSLGLSDCKEICVKNCSCNAYASAQSDGTGCKFSQGQKVDFPGWEGQGEVFYVRNNTAVVSKGNNSVVEKDHPWKRRLWITIGASVVSFIILTVAPILCYLLWRCYCHGGKNRSSKIGIGEDTELLLYRAGTSVAAIDELSHAHKLELSGRRSNDLALFKFSSIEIATDHFSDANKIGQGGFGTVYKGKLVQGQEIAVKRLCRSSRQGLEEYKNEVVLISKLQHRNLVRLLGCCIRGEERILVYEYLPNNSLDSFLFDATKRALLDWKKRVCIIEGIAQGLLYLHKYSRLTIIHRDLKSSNILLDHDMNPKISDFGTARIFEDNESQANTKRIVGTYGYMSPEYALNGLFSVKSDIFSFGVMMLEIISGIKSNGYYQSNHSSNLLGHAWHLYREGRCMELVDPTIKETCSQNEVLRCVHVGLLCVQESAVDRPTMSNVVSMLSNELAILPAPKRPAFSSIAGVNDAAFLESTRPCSINDVTVTDIEAR